MLLILLVAIASLIVIWNEVQYRFGFDSYYPQGNYEGSDFPVVSYAAPGCNVADVFFFGDLYTFYESGPESERISVSADSLMYYLGEAEATPNIEVIVLEIDSYGGSPTAAYEVVQMMNEVVTKPIIVQVREAADSAAYWIASAGDVIFATEVSEVGSLAVTYSYVGESGANAREGKIFYELSTGEFKDSGNPAKALTESEYEMFQRDLDIIHNVFVKSVAENRGLQIEEVRTLADGSVMLGEMAKEKGLIDEVGSFEEVDQYIRDTYGIEPVRCW